MVSRFDLPRLTLVREVPPVNTGAVTKTKPGGRRVWIKYKGKNIKASMTCTFTYPRLGVESSNVDCK